MPNSQYEKSCIEEVFATESPSRFSENLAASQMLHSRIFELPCSLTAAFGMAAQSMQHGQNAIQNSGDIKSRLIDVETSIPTHGFENSGDGATILGV